MLGVAAAEALEVDDEDWRDVVNLDLLDCLLVLDASVAVPGIRCSELFWSIKLPEAVVDGHAVSFVHVQVFTASKRGIFDWDVPRQAAKECPTLLFVKLNKQFQLVTVFLWLEQDLAFGLRFLLAALFLL